MSSPYRSAQKRGPEVLELTLRPEVWGSVIATMVVTFITGLSLCATAEETLGLATGTLLLLATLAMAPVSAIATGRRPSHLDIEEDHLVVTYPGGPKRHIARADLFIHQIDRGRVALDRAGKLVIYIDELKPQVRRDVLHLLTRLAGYDVTTPAFAARRLSPTQINPEIRFETWPTAAPALGALITVFGIFAVILMILFAPGSGVAMLSVGSVTCFGLTAALHLCRSTVKFEGDRLVVAGWWGAGLVLELEDLRVEPASWPTGLTLVAGARRVRLHRFIFKAKEWETLVGLLSRTLGYDVTEPATEAARLAMLARPIA